MAANAETTCEVVRKVGAVSEELAASYNALGESTERASAQLQRLDAISRRNEGEVAWCIQFGREEGTA